MKPFLMLVATISLLVAGAAFSIGLVCGAYLVGVPSKSDMVELFSALGGWISAIGTFTAAVVALVLASRQEKLAIIGRRQEIYDAFYYLKMHMTQKLSSAEMSQVSKFFYHVRSAKVYFPAISHDVEKYFDACFWIADGNQVEHQRTDESRKNARARLDLIIELGPKIELAMLADIRV